MRLLVLVFGLVSCVGSVQEPSVEVDDSQPAPAVTLPDKGGGSGAGYACAPEQYSSLAGQTVSVPVGCVPFYLDTGDPPENEMPDLYDAPDVSMPVQ